MSGAFDAFELLDCYRRGVFPMAQYQDDPDVFLVDPDVRGVLPLQGFHIPRRLKKTVRKDPFEVKVNTAFGRVMEACAGPRSDGDGTWINAPILNLYSQLHRLGHAHSVECWSNGTLVGGLYGVSLGGAFFGESMFTRETDASKVALVHLVGRLLVGGYKLLDAQFMNTHLEQFGILEMSRDLFHDQLSAALAVEGDFYSLDKLSSESSSIGMNSGSGILHLITQTS